MRLGSLVLAALGALAGCAIEPEYERGNVAIVVDSDLFDDLWGFGSATIGGLGGVPPQSKTIFGSEPAF